MNGKKHIAILGFGREGKSVLKFLRRDKKLKNSDITILDSSEKTIAPKGVSLRLGKNYLKNLEDFDLVFRSPGVPFEAPELKKARKNGVKFSSATKLFFERCKAPVIGVTGTKGKGTTSYLLYKILKSHQLHSGQAAKKDVYLAGNIGTPAIDILPKLKRDSIVILELSSFQLQDLDRSPKISVVLEVFPDHQDSHRNLREYYRAKSNVARHQGPKDAVFFFGDYPKSRAVASTGRGKKVPVFPKEFTFFDPAELKIRGAHNFRNVALATAVADYLRIPKKTIVRAVKNFRGLEHRLEFVRQIGNVSFYNDSASTNPQTSSAALKSFPDDAISIILGGSDKGLDYKPLKHAIARAKPGLVVLMGANAKKIAKALAGSGVKTKFAGTQKEAVRLAYESLRGLPRPGVVIYSPGAASFDMFKNYADRGERFKKIVRGISPY
ncbi:MAG: UDP-N-acetylmuramoyl-L-alanine--D-glutamate ligase [Candidatus Liptonbacteria bacterium]|nr:UDP-N-acetylmuramoyl-L-alanine--D-glutamate ligase [Candidatus Liptonbacteria bacterium]